MNGIDLFNWNRLNVLGVDLFLFCLILYFLFRKASEEKPFIRRISGLEALDEAIGRAAELGKGAVFVPGLMDVSEVQTLAGLNLLGHVAKRTAELDTPLFAPMARPFVMSLAQEIVRQAYLEKGRPDLFRADRINYLTADQFGYVAGVSGILLREKPAACFYLGFFQAESLILAETGNAIGAMQIAGTAEISQIPFFIVSCDYTLIGEEIFAASAYLSKNPREIQSLKGQDTCKALVILFILVFSLLVTLAQIPWVASSPLGTLVKSTLHFLDSK